MKESDRIMVEQLLSQINRESVSLSASPTALKPNTQAYNELARKVTDWQRRLQRMSNKLDGNQFMQQSRMQQLKSIPRDQRYAEKQSIDSNMHSIHRIKQKVTQAERALIELLLQVITPSEGEVLFNAIAQLKSIHDDNQKLIKLKHIVNLSGTISAQAVIREPVNIPASSSASSIPSMLLCVSITLLVIERLMKGK